MAQAFSACAEMRPGHPAALQPLPPQYEAGGASPSSLDLSSNLETANRSWSVYQKEGLRTELSLDELLPIAWCVLTFALFGVVYLGAFLWSRRKNYDAHGSLCSRLVDRFVRGRLAGAATATDTDTTEGTLPRCCGLCDGLRNRLYETSPTVFCGFDLRSELAAHAVRLSVCVGGLGLSQVVWAYQQERIMTRPFETGELFASSNFLVFANRCFAVAITLALQLALPARNPGGGAAPLYVFALSSFSNVVSSMSRRRRRLGDRVGDCVDDEERCALHRCLLVVEERAADGGRRVDDGPR